MSGPYGDPIGRAITWVFVWIIAFFAIIMMAMAFGSCLDWLDKRSCRERGGRVETTSIIGADWHCEGAAPVEAPR